MTDRLLPDNCDNIKRGTVSTVLAELMAIKYDSVTRVCTFCKCCCPPRTAAPSVGFTLKSVLFVYLTYGVLATIITALLSA